MKIPIFKKMMFGFIAIIVLMVLSTSYVLLELREVSSAAQITLSSNVKSVDQAKQLKTIIFDEEGYAQKYLISGDKTYFDILLDSFREFDNTLNSLRTLQVDNAELAIVKKIGDTHRWLETSFISKQENKSAMDTGKLSEEWHNSFEALQRQLDHIIGLNQLTIGNSMAKVETTTSRSTRIALFILICTVLLAVFMALLISRTITKPIDNLAKGIGRVAKGDFEPVKINSNDEIALLADSFNNMSQQLKDTNELKAEMMQQVSHELRNPLTIIQATHDLLKKETAGELNDKQLRLLESLNTGIKRISNFNDQFLDIAKFDAGMMEYNMVTTDLLKIIEPVAKEAEIVASHRDISLNIIAKKALPKISGDHRKIRVIFRNLLSNAIKYSHDGGEIDLHISPSKFGIRAVVRDHGVGIPPEDLPKVFTKFFQAKNSGMSKTKGTGLGLALIKAYTEGQGGRVLAESKLDSGSSFTVEFPAAQSKKMKNEDGKNADDKYVSY